MADMVGTLAKQFIDGLHSKESKEVFEHLSLLVDHLENKNDPDPTEIRLMVELYEFIEKFNLVQHNLKTYANERLETPGSKLTSLYEEIDETGAVFSD